MSTDPNYKSDCYYEFRPFYKPNEPITYTARYKFKKDSVSLMAVENQILNKDFTLINNGTIDEGYGAYTYGYRKVSNNYYEATAEGSTTFYRISGDTLKLYDKEGLSYILFKVN